MKIETQRHEDCTATLTVEVDRERVQTALRTAAKKVARQYSFPGFRPGKAPYETVLRHVGEKALMEVALEDLGQQVYEEVLDQEKLEISAPGSLSDVKFDPLVLTFAVPLKPEVELGDYRARRLPYTPGVVDDVEVQKALEDLRERQAVTAPVERPAAMGDVVTADVKAFLNEGINPSDYLLTQKDMALQLDEKNADRELPGLEQQVVDMRAGEEKKFDLTFAEDYPNTSLRGQVAHVEVAAKEVKHRNVPEWSDELAKALGEFESVADVQKRVREDLQRQAEMEADRAYADQVVNELVAQATVKYPPVLLENQIDDLLEDFGQHLQQREHMKLEDYLKVSGKTMEDLRNENRSQAETMLKRSLVLSKVIEAEDLNVDKNEVDGRVSLLEAQFGGKLDKNLQQAISSDRIRSSLALNLLTDKVYDRLVALARGEDIPLPASAEPEGKMELPADAPPPAATGSLVETPAREATPVTAESQVVSPTSEPTP